MYVLSEQSAEVKAMSKNIILCGVGGQGTVLASKLLSAASMAKGLPVKSAETIGMAQRGGSVTSHIRIGEGAYSPLIPMGKADVIIAFEPAEAVRMLPYLKKDGVIIVNSRPVMPVTAALGGSDYNGTEMTEYLSKKVGNLTVVDSDKACEELGSSKIINVLLLGAAISRCDIGLSKEDIRSAIGRIVPEKFHSLNFRALDYLG